MFEGTKSIVTGVIIIVVGALLGSFIGGFIGTAFPYGTVANLFARDITAGLHPATLDLRVIELTFGCVFKFNVPSVIGILASAYIFRSLLK